MPTERQIKIADYLALQGESVDADAVATGEEAEILSRIIDNNLERVDMADRVPIDALYDGADMLKLVLTTEFVLPALGSEVTIKTYTASHSFGGSQPPTTIQDAFARSRADIENQIISDPPYLYIDAGLEAIRRQQQAERNARNRVQEDLDAGDSVLTSIESLTVQQILERLVRIRERVIRQRPFSSDRSREPGAGDLLFGRDISPNQIVLRQRLAEESDAIRESLGQVIIHRVLFDVSIEGQPKTQVAYNLEVERDENFINGTRFITGQPVSSELRSRYENLTAIMFDGDLPVEEEGQSIEELRAKLRESERASSEFENYLAATKLLVEAENVRSVLLQNLQNLGISEEEIDFSTVNENFDMLEAGTNDMFELLEGPEGVARYISRIRPDSALLVDGGFEVERVARLRSFMSTIKGFIFEIRKQDVDAQINAQRELEKLLASEEKNRILEAKSFIILDSKNRSMEFRIPIEFGEKSIQVLAIKRYLGLELSSGDLFDTETKKEIQSFQNLNTNKMTELIEGDLGRPPSGQDILEMIPEEYGLIGPYTFLTMKVLGGLERAVEEVLDLGGLIPNEITGTDEDSLQTLARETARDGYRPPWKDANYYYFMYVTEETRNTVNADIPGSYARMIAQNGELALRRGVEELFEFHARSKTWTVEGKIEEHRVFNRLLRYQNKIEDKMSKNQRFTLTIQQQTLAENLGVSEIPRVDVLFGQSLKVGAKPIFASLHEIHSPTERPNSKFKITVKIRKELLDAIPTDPSRTATIGQTIAAARRVSSAVRDVINNRDEIARRFGDSALERQAQVEAAILDKTKSVNDGLKWVQNNKKEAIEKGVKGAFGLAKKFSRDAALAKQFGNTTIASELSRKQEASLVAQVLEYNKGDYVLPVTSTYTLYEFNTMIDNVAAMFDRFAKDFDDFGKEGGRIRPAINLKEEAKHLREVKPAMTSFLSANGIVKRDFLREDVQIKITFVESLMERKFLPPKDLETGSQPPEIVIEDIAGHLPIAISYVEPGKQARRLQQATLVLAQKYPWNIPRTMAYLSNLEALNEEANNYDASCLQINLFSEELEYSERDPIQRMQVYTHPRLFVLPGPELPSGIRTDKAEAKLANAHTSIKSSLQKIQEDLSIEGDGPIANAFRRDIIRIERSKTYQIVPELPTVELCTLESLFDEFLDKFDLKTLFCNYAACIPDLPWPPSFSWDLDFTIPEIPRMPSFDPMAIIIPRLELAILDLILGFLCGLIRGILDTLRFPDCEDLANFGKAAWDELWDNSRGPDKRLLVMQDAAKVMDDLDIPSEAFPDVSNLFDQLANILTPAELCSLLDGTADAETLTIVLELVQKSYPDLERYFRNEADISMFFMLLGKFVDPELCNKISNTSNIIIGDIFCPDRPMTSLRRRMQDNRATAEEIAKAMTDATKRREAFKELFAKDPMADVIPAAGSGIPGPYDNDVSKELAKMSIEGSLDIVELFIRNDIASFLPALLSTESSQKGPGDAGFDPLAEAEFLFLREHMIKISNSASENIAAAESAVRRIDFAQELEDQMNERIERSRALRRSGFGARAIFSGFLVAGDIENEEVRDFLEDELGENFDQGKVDVFGLENIVISIESKGIRIFDTLDPEKIQETKFIRFSEHPARLTVEDFENYQEQVREEVRLILTSRDLGSLKIPKPGKFHEIGDGRYRVSPAYTEIDGQEKEILFFDLSNKNDVLLITEILSFPMRNLKDEAKIAEEFQKNLSDQSSVVTNVEKFFNAGWSFNIEDIRYLSPEQLESEDPTAFRRSNRLAFFDPEDRHLGISLTAGNEDQITYQELPVKSDHINDCYNVYHPTRTGWKGTVYNDSISDSALARRREVRDFTRDEENYTLLRPAAFAELFINSWGVIQADNSPLLRGDPSIAIDEELNSYGVGLWNKLAGSMAPNLEEQAEQVRGEYEQIVEAFIDKLSENIRNSKFFNFNGIADLAKELTSEFEISRDGTCYNEKKPFINFEKLREDIFESYQGSLSQEEYNPANRDFNKPGPLEDSLTGQMIFLYVKTYIIELVLKGTFVFSNYSAQEMLKQEVIKDYIKSFMISSIDDYLTRDVQGLFTKEITKVGNDTNLPTAIKNIVDAVASDLGFIKSLDEVFEPKFKSYKEEFLVNLSREQHDVPDYSFIITPQRSEVSKHNISSAPVKGSRKGFVPLNNQFRGAGPIYSDKVGLERLKKGHFFMERYFSMDPAIVGAYFHDRPDSLANKLIKKAGEDNREVETMHSVNQFQGMFNQKELNMLIHEIHLAISEEAPELLEEVNEMVTALSRPSGLKMGLRICYIPATSGAGQVKGRNTFEYLYGENPVIKEEVYDTRINIKAQERAIADTDLLSTPIEEQIGLNDFEDQIGPNVAAETLINQAHRVAKFRSYIADANPRFDRVDNTVPLIDRSKGGNVVDVEGSAEAEFYWRNISEVASASDNDDPLGFRFFASEEERVQTAIGVASIAEEGIGNNTRNFYPGRPQNVLFPTPLASGEIDLCITDMLSVYTDNPDGSLGAIRGIINRDTIAGKNRELKQNFLGLGSGQNRGLSFEPSDQVNYLFDFLFPLNRYQSLFLIQSQVILDRDLDVFTLMDPTREMISSIVEQLKDPAKINKRPRYDGTGTYSILVSDQQSGGPGPMAKYKLGGMSAAIDKLVKRAVPTLIRGQAAFLDPAYKDIKKIFDNEPCKTRAGLTAGTLGASLALSTDLRGGKELENGFDADKAYNPMNIQGAVDLSLVINAIAFSPLGAGFIYIPALLNVIEHLGNSVAGQNKKRYGKFLSPVGLLGLAMPELPGEVHRDKVREARCDDDDNRTTPQDFVLCEDIRQEEEE